MIYRKMKKKQVVLMFTGPACVYYGVMPNIRITVPSSLKCEFGVQGPASVAMMLMWAGVPYLPLLLLSTLPLELDLHLSFVHPKFVILTSHQQYDCAPWASTLLQLFHDL